MHLKALAQCDDMPLRVFALWGLLSFRLHEFLVRFPYGMIQVISVEQRIHVSMLGANGETIGA